jgi:Cu(I)/Ag(I) efflux system membrane fusion protein
MRSFHWLIIGIILGVSGYYGLLLLSASNGQMSSDTAKGTDGPLYWVAPMDPNFRKDGPGKSPMGMDLVPVYSQESDPDSPGTVKISPDIVNNLGVRTAIAKMGIIEGTIQTVGYVQYDQDKLVHVHPRVEGWIEALYVKTSGEQVKKGTPLYALYSPELVNAQEEFLLASKSQSQPLINAAIQRLQALQLPSDALNKLKKDGKVQQTIIFNAPQDGVVDNLNIREGFFVQPGTTLMSIGALDEVWVEAEVFARQGNQVKINQPVIMTLDFLPSRQWQGKVDYVYPTLDADTRTIRVRLRFNNPQFVLKPNMFAQIQIHTQSTRQGLLVPKEAVIRTGQQDRIVLALGDGKFKSVEVSLGAIGNRHIQILRGIFPNDEVVTSAQFLLDSESNISSDFMRYSHDMDSPVPTAQVDGVITQIDPKNWVLTIHRGPIEKWGRGPATMDFSVSPDIDIATFAVQEKIFFTFEIHQGRFVVVDIASVENAPSSLPKDKMAADDKMTMDNAL